PISALFQHLPERRRRSLQGSRIALPRPGGQLPAAHLAGGRADDEGGVEGAGRSGAGRLRDSEAERVAALNAAAFPCCSLDLPCCLGLPHAALAIDLSLSLFYLSRREFRPCPPCNCSSNFRPVTSRSPSTAGAGR